MPPRPSLRAFLATARAALTAPPSRRPTPLTFVVGNESADLDSLCSALLVAYLRTHAPPNNTLHIPLCHIPRDDLTLRPEFAAVLRDAGSGPDDVLTLSDLPSPSSSSSSPADDDLKPEDTRWFLVDHNALTGALGAQYGDRVVGCIDHHADEGAVPRDCDELRVIEKSGSCASLVVTRCGASIWDAALTPDPNLDRQLALLALAPILVDTANLGDANKTTPTDEDAVRYLETKILASPSSSSISSSSSDADPKDTYDRTELFTRISHLKNDLSPLSLRDVLRKDYKEWTEAGLRLGTSAAPRAFRHIVDHHNNNTGGEGVEAFAQAMEDWGREKDLDLFAFMTGFVREDSSNDGESGSGNFARELLVWALTPAAVEPAASFARDYADKLELKTWGDGELDLDLDLDPTTTGKTTTAAAAGGKEARGGQWRRCWTQGKLENSRKQIAPLLRDALREKGKKKDWTD